MSSEDNWSYHNFEHFDYSESQNQFLSQDPQEGPSTSEKIMNNSGPQNQQVPQDPEEGPSTSEEIMTKKNKQRKIVMLSGEFKNIPKNFVRGLKSHIMRRHPELCLKDSDIRKFLNLKPEKACKQSLERALQTPLLKQIGRMYFGQMQWSLEFLEENKMALESFFRFNNLWI